MLSKDVILAKLDLLEANLKRAKVRYETAASKFPGKSGVNSFIERSMVFIDNMLSFVSRKRHEVLTGECS